MSKYWWDFEGPDTVIVESENSNVPLAEFEYDYMGGDGEIMTHPDGTQSRQGCASAAIELAEQFINDLEGQN